jgi:hypothetical protein
MKQFWNEALFLSSSIDLRNRIALLQGVHASPTFLSDNSNVKTVTNVEQRWNKLRWRNRSVKWEIISVSFSNTNLISTGLFSNTGNCHDRPGTNRCFKAWSAAYCYKCFSFWMKEYTGWCHFKKPTLNDLRYDQLQMVLSYVPVCLDIYSWWKQ